MSQFRFEPDDGRLARGESEFGRFGGPGAGSARAGARADGPSSYKRRKVGKAAVGEGVGVTGWVGMDEIDELDPSSEEEEDQLEPIELSVSASQSPSKRKNTNKNGQVDDGPGSTFGGPRKGGRLGRLSAMLDQLPMEILAEILSHLPSASLLRLSRVAKLFRNLLHDRHASRTIWMAAFAREGIPKLEAGDLSEPAYAAMIWDKECQKCGRKKVHHIHYRLRRRMCDPCLKEMIRRPEDVQRQGIKLHEATYLCTPHTTMPPWRGDYLRGQYYLEPELVKSSDHLFKLAFLDQIDPLPESLIPPHPPLESSASTYYPAPAPATAAVTAAAPAPVAGAAAAATTTTTPAPPASPPVPAFDPRTRVGQYVQDWVGDAAHDQPGRMERAMKDAEALTQWQAKLEDSRRAARSDHKSVRIQEITRHLREEGFEDADITPTVGPFSKVLKEVEQPYPLTDRVWRKIKEPVMREVQRFRELRVNPPPPEAPLVPQELPPTIMVEPAVLQQFGVVGGRVMVQARVPGAGAGAAPLLGGGFGSGGAYWTAPGGAAQVTGQQPGQAHGIQHAHRPAPTAYGHHPASNPTAGQLHALRGGFPTAQQPQPGRPHSQAGLYYQQLQQQQAILVARSRQLRQQQPQQPLQGQDLIRALLAQQSAAGVGQMHQMGGQRGLQYYQQQQHQQQQQQLRQQSQPRLPPAQTLLQRPAQPALRQQSAPPQQQVDHLTLLNPLLAPQPVPRPTPAPAPSVTSQSSSSLPAAPPLIPIPGCGTPQPAFALSSLRAPPMVSRSASQDGVATAAAAQVGYAPGAAGTGHGQGFGVGGQGVFDARRRQMGRAGGVGMGQQHLLADWGQVRRPASAPPPVDGGRGQR